MAVDTSGAQIAPVKSTGVLDCWVRQPVTNSPSETNGSLIYTEKWKTNYGDARSILGSVSPGTAISAVHAALGTKVEYAALKYPTCPVRNGLNGRWTLMNTNVEELVDGNHAIVTFTYQANYGATDVQTLTEDPYGDTWDITWASYSISPFAFCAEIDHENDDAPKEKPMNADKNMDFTKPASRSNVEKFVKGETRGSYQTIDAAGTYTMYAYPDDAKGSKFKYLDGAEAEVYKKYALGKQCVWHYPIVTHTTVSRGPFSVNYDYNKTLGQDIDHYSNSLSSCPYSFNTDATKGPVYKWLKVADDMQQQKSKTYTTFTRKEQWWGVVKPDDNFYGNGTFNHTEEGILSGRWKLGEV